MRSFYKLAVNVVNTPLMIEVMRKQTDIFDEGGLCKSLPADAKKIGLAVLQMTNGLALTSAELRRIDHDHKFPIAPTSDDRYLAVLSGQVMCLSGDECPAMNAGEIWWTNSKVESLIVNKSGDDAVLLGITIRMDL